MVKLMEPQLGVGSCSSNLKSDKMKDRVNCYLNGECVRFIVGAEAAEYVVKALVSGKVIGLDYSFNDGNDTDVLSIDLESSEGALNILFISKGMPESWFDLFASV